MKLNGGSNDLLDRIAADPRFGVTREDLEKLLDVRKFVGCAPAQTEDFLEQWVRPVLEGQMPPGLCRPQLLAVLVESGVLRPGQITVGTAES